MTSNDIEMQKLAKIVLLQKFIRGSTARTIEKFAGVPAVVREVARRDDFIYGETLAFILVSGSDLTLQLKVHFEQAALSSLLGKSLGLPQSQVMRHQVDDFSREFCNLAGGELVALFNANGQASSLSLPFLTSGLDELFFSDPNYPSETRDFWEIECDGSTFVCTTVLEIRDPASFAARDLAVGAGENDNEAVFF